MPMQKFKSILKSAYHDIDPGAVGVIKRLKDSGFDGYLVGGGVRDLLVGLKPKDFDIATNALPNEVKRKVPNSFIIGRRFKLVHAKRGEKIFEVATYRREATQEELESADATEINFVEENFFGSLKEDSFRRDFTVNALFYDPLSEDLVDHCGGLNDIESQTLRIIGDPTERLKEDPIRILRAVRLSQKLNFSIEPTLRQAILTQSEDLQRSVLPRRREEWLKFFRLEKPELALWEMLDLGILKSVLPAFDELLNDSSKSHEFMVLIQRFSLAGINFHDPVELFAAVVYAFLVAQYGYAFNINEVSENPRFQIFCRDELGIFKAEAISIVMAIQFIHTLSRHDQFLKKGDRRRRAVLANPHFALALKLGLLSGELSNYDYTFWSLQIEDSQKKIHQPDDSGNDTF